jgi:hypothetical protein
MKREVMRDRSVQEFLIKPSELKALGNNTVGFTVQGTGTSLVNRAVTVDDTADLKRDVSIRGFFKDLASGRLLEDGSSPFDFLRAIRNGEVLNDILGMESRDDAHSSLSSKVLQEGNRQESENEEEGGKGQLPQYEAHISGTIQDQKKEISADGNSRIAERKIHGATNHDFFSHLTKWRILELAKCRILESHSSPLGFLNAMQNGDIWSNTQKGNTANESGGQHWVDHEHREAVEVPSDVPEFNQDMDSKEDHDIQDVQVADGRECVHMDPVYPADSQKRKPRHTTVVKEFGVQKSRLLGPRRRVAHEITQSTPKPCMVVLSSSKKAETKLKSNPKTKPAAPRKKDMSQSLSLFSVFSQRQNRCYV